MQQKNNQNTEGEGENNQLSNPYDFFVVKNFEFEVDYCCTLHTITAKYSVAINSVDSNNWILATNREFDSLIENNTFEWQKVQEIKNIVSSRWIFTMKSKSNGSHEYKVCFIAKGYSQIYGKDYKETFTLTTIMASIRLLMQIAVYYDLLIHHMDVKSTYLNATLDYEIYVEPPEGFKVKNGNYVWKLKKSLYGLKQSGQTWNKTFHT